MKYQSWGTLHKRRVLWVNKFGDNEKLFIFLWCLFSFCILVIERSEFWPDAWVPNQRLHLLASFISVSIWLSSGQWDVSANDGVIPCYLLKGKTSCPKLSLSISPAWEMVTTGAILEAMCWDWKRLGPLSVLINQREINFYFGPCMLESLCYGSLRWTTANITLYLPLGDSFEIY